MCTDPAVVAVHVPALAEEIRHVFAVGRRQRTAAQHRTVPVRLCLRQPLIPPPWRAGGEACARRRTDRV